MELLIDERSLIYLDVELKVTARVGWGSFASHTERYINFFHFVNRFKWFIEILSLDLFVSKLKRD
jgi:hypothetical protein